MEKLVKKVGNILKNHIVDTTAISIVGNPIFAVMEACSGMSGDEVLCSRVNASGLFYLGAGFVFAKGRDLSSKFFSVNEKSGGRKKIIHDSIYNSVFSIAFSIPVYLHSGAELNEVFIGTAGAVVLGLASGPIMGYSLDSFRDFCGTKKYENLPNKIKLLPQKIKYGLAAASVGVAASLTYGVCEVKENFFPKEKIKKEIGYKDLEVKLGENIFDATSYFVKN